MSVTAITVLLVGQSFDATADALDALSCSLPKSLDALARALPQALDALAGTSAQLGDALTDTTKRLVSPRPDTLADTFNTLAGPLAHLLHRLADAAGQVADDLRVVVDRLDQPDDDRLDGVEADLDQRIDLDVVDDQADVAERGVGSDVERQQVEHLGVQADVRLEVVERELDPAHVRVGVDEHVGPVALGRMLGALFGGRRLVLAEAFGALRLRALGQLASPLGLHLCDLLVGHLEHPPQQPADAGHQALEQAADAKQQPADHPSESSQDAHQPAWVGPSSLALRWAMDCTSYGPRGWRHRDVAQPLTLW